MILGSTSKPLSFAKHVSVSVGYFLSQTR